MCEKCHHSCLKCEGPLDSDCIECPQGVAYDRFTQKCNNPTGKYVINGQLGDCHPNCRSCDGPLETDC